MGGCLSCSFYSMAESGWLSQGYLTEAELATYRVPVDLAARALVGGYVVACLAFCEQGFGAPSH
jgi:hypothetical protein